MAPFFSLSGIIQRRISILIGIGLTLLIVIAAAALGTNRLNHKTTHQPLVVALQSDGPLVKVRTQATQPLAVLAEQGVVVGPYDRVYVNGQEFSFQELAQTAWNAPIYHIRVVRSIPITLKDGDQTRTIYTTSADVGRALDAAGVGLYLGDRVTPGLRMLITNGLVIEIVRSVPLTVIADGRQLNTRAVGPTVGDALAEIGLAPLGRDYTLPALETPLEPGMVVQIVRVFENTDIYGKRSP